MSITVSRPGTDDVTAPVPAALRGSGTVLLVGGFATPAVLLEPMRRWLARCGYDVVPVTLGAGMGCAGEAADLLTGLIEDRAERTGRPVRLVAHSRGGQFARAATARVPRRVAALVTLGTPFDLFGLSWPLLTAAATVSALGSLGVPRLARLECLVGPCCARFRTSLRGPWPDGVAFTSVYSSTDRSVPARASQDPSARNVEVRGSHFGLLSGRGAQLATARALARSGQGSAPAVQEAVLREDDETAEDHDDGHVEQGAPQPLPRQQEVA